MRTRCCIVLALLTCFTQTALARAQTSLEGITTAKHDLELGFEINGVVAEVHVEPGARVRQGDPLVELSAADAHAHLALLRIRSASTYETDAAKAEWDLAKVELEQIKDAFSRGGATDFEVRRRALEADRNRLAYELFIQRRQEAELQLRQAEVNVERYTLRAPRDGIIEAIAVAKGELVREVTPVLRLVDISVLKIEVATPARLADRLRVGERAVISLLGPEHQPSVQAEIRHIAAVGDPASGLRLVSLECANPTEHPAGDTVFVTFEDSPSPDPGSAP